MKFDSDEIYSLLLDIINYFLGDRVIFIQRVLDAAEAKD